MVVGPAMVSPWVHPQAMVAWVFSGVLILALFFWLATEF